MIIDCIADLHGYYPNLQGGDLLIVAGDLTARDEAMQYGQFAAWLDRQKYTKKILIAGNHDNFFENQGFDEIRDAYKSLNVNYLCDSGTVFEGLNIWGSPWTRTFEGMNPHCKAFTFDTEEELAKKWEVIPTEIDILVTHSPPFTIHDMTERGEQVGSTHLMAEHLIRLRPKLWVFGHIHEAYGKSGPYQWNNTKYVNASHVNERYQPVNKPIRIILEEKSGIQAAENAKD